MLKKNHLLVTKRGIYLLPNILTTGALFAGFFAIIAATNGEYGIAAMAIFLAMVLDGLDGRVARWTNTVTAFGSEYDSLSDMVSFGVAPALVIYHWSLVYLGQLGWLCAFIYTACVALRLARFNTQVKTIDKRYFQGLPCPTAAAVIAGMVWAGADYVELNRFIAVVTASIALLLSALMVSNIRYHSFKEIDLRGKVRFVSIIFIVLAFALVSIDPPWVLLSIFFTYTLAGPALTLYNLRKTKKARHKEGKSRLKK